MFKRTADPAFDIEAPVRKDDSVRDYQYYSYHAIQPDLRSRIEHQVHDTIKYFLPCEAFIEIEGELVTKVASNTPYAYDPNVRVVLVNNGIMEVFESAIYFTDVREIESIEREVDAATTSMMFGKDTSDHPDHLQYIKVLTARYNEEDDQQEA